MPADHAGKGSAAHVLVVEDDRELARLLSEQLGLSGYAVTVTGRLGEARERLAGARFDLIVLDLNLPDGDGLDLAAEVRQDGSTPVLMLTARADVKSRVAGLYAGANDYLTKPFNVAELLARVHVQLREAGARGVVAYGDLILDRQTHACTVGEAVEYLPEREFELLHLLVRYRGRIFTKEDLERALYGVVPPDSNTIEVYVYNVRRKLRGMGLGEVIRTVRNRGYVVV
ncbi:MAG: response regulator transcription factor [Trueperaceae bacterium]|nr:response regulator transcription factor [Trueperaceae bacterium]MCO5173579.1 response regulator transcription factor [Trueperaceae bacterium]MCW5818567.1 response regulator transcription factor [Trueperaceae bacterium]